MAHKSASHTSNRAGHLGLQHLLRLLWSLQHCGRMKTTCGIYLITCTKPNGDKVFYAGQSCDCTRRRQEHFGSLRKGRHYNRKMQAAYNKHGNGCFAFEVVERCETWELSDKERPWLERFSGQRNSFNVAKDPDKTAYGLKRSDETKKRMSIAKTGQRHSEKTRILISEIQRGKKRGPCSDERKRKIGEAQMGEKNHSFGKTGFSHHRSKPVVATRIDDGSICVFGSSRDAVAAGFSQACISGACAGKLKTHRGHYWRFATAQEIADHNPATLAMAEETSSLSMI